MNNANYCRRIRIAGAAFAIVLGFTAGIPRESAAQVFTEFPILTAGSNPRSITTGPDGNLWFTEFSGLKIGRITPAGGITEFPVNIFNTQPNEITAGPDGNLWFTAWANKIGRITPAGAITVFDLPTFPSEPEGITTGPDGNLWFTMGAVSRIGRITTAGSITEFILPAGRRPTGITAGPDGNLWFTELNGDRIGRITPTGTPAQIQASIVEFVVPGAGSKPNGITAGPDGALWFTQTDSNQIGRITTAGVITNEFAVPPNPGIASPKGITTGPDGNLWFTEQSGRIGRITPAGVLTEFPIPTITGQPLGITRGPDGNLWFTEHASFGGNNIGRLVPPAASNQLLAAVLPSSRSVQTTQFATAFASILNNSGATANGCGIAPVTSVPAAFSFQTTNPATNTLTGTPNTRVSIPAGSVQTFLMAFQANAPFTSTEVALGFGCTGLTAAATIVGVNTLLLTFDTNPVPDMIAVGLTPTNDGFSRIPGVGGTGIFVIAATNIGMSKQLTARARLLDASTPATTLVCETFSSGAQLGQCMATPSASVTRTINNNENTTWTAFITATGAIPADPAKHRVIFQFEDGPAIRGSTSTALTTTPP